jgi:hypothetical protein
MDFNVTHFLVSKTGQNLASDTSPESFLDPTTNRVNLNAGQIGVMQIDSYGNYGTLGDADASGTDFVAVPTDSSTLTLGNRGIKIFQGLDRTDPIGAELGYLSSGDILYKNITSLRLLKGISTETAQVKFFGGTVTVESNKFQFGQLSGTQNVRVPSLAVEADKDYSFSVRVQSAQANTLSPHGLIWGTSVKANNTLNDGTVHNLYTPFSVAWGIVKGFADYKPLQDFVKVSAYVQLLDENSGTGTSGNGIQSFLFHYGAAPSSTTFSYDTGGLSSADITAVDVNSTTNTTWQLAAAAATIDIGDVSSSAVVAGDHYVLTFIVEALPQPNFVNNSDITLFPYKWDFARVQGFFVSGPLAPSPFDTITTQTPIVASRSETGVITSLTYNTTSLAAINSDVVRFPNLLTREVRHMAHQYQSYALKYKQQFSGVKYNPMLLDPQQTIYVDGAADAVYDVLMIEYAPNQDYSYSSTSLMTQMTMVAGSTTNQKTQLGKLGAALATAAGITLITDTAV